MCPALFLGLMLSFVHVNSDIDATINCRDIDPNCQQWAANGYCYDTDFIRHFCPISCRAPKCSNHFPLFTTKSNHWRQITSTLCHYPSINAYHSLYFHQINNISLNQCQTQCTNNLFCSHILYIEKIILAQKPVTDYTHFLFSKPINNISHNTLFGNDNVTINICIHSFIPLRLCKPICPSPEITKMYLISTKLDPNTQTKTAQLLKPFIFSNLYEYISLFSLSMNERYGNGQYWDIVHTFNHKHSIVPYESHEYYHARMDINDNNGFPRLEAPKLSTFAGTNNVRLEFESRVNRALEVSWVNFRNDKEIFQESLEANVWSVTKARKSFDGHIFVIRDTETKQWLTSYKNNPSHTHVFITVTPFGVCVRDNSQKQKSTLDSSVVNELLIAAQNKRWGSDSNILEVWSIYEQILWSVSASDSRNMIGKVLNLMGEIFLFGSFEEIFEFNMAWKYFEMAAMLNNGDGMYNMAFMIEKKLLPTQFYHYLPKSLYRMAMLNYWCAAQSDSHKAQLLLGFRYLNGIGMNKSCAHSVFFYQKLAESVRNDARSLDKYVNVIDLANPPSKSEDLHMNDQNLRYYKQYANMGRAWANNHLGQVYFFGLRGIAQNYEMAAEHFEAAVNANDAMAANYLGRLYWNGLGRKRNLNRTLELFTFAAEKNVSSAQNNLAFMLWKGIGTKANLTQALKWFKRAANNGFAQAQYYLGEIYWNGEIGLSKNVSMAVTYYILATKQRHYRSMYELAMLYKDGIGVDRDCEKAVALFKYVAEYHNVKFELENARTATESGHFAEAFVIYSQKAEEGYINGQINTAFLAKNEYFKYLYNVETNPFYDGMDNVKTNESNLKFKTFAEKGQCKNNISAFVDYESDIFCDENEHEKNNIFGTKYRHKVTMPHSKELAFRYYSFAAAQNHSRSLRILGDYYWYQWAPINLFSYLANISFGGMSEGEYEWNHKRAKNDSSEMVLTIDEFDQRSMALSIAYLSTPQSIVKYSNFEKSANDKFNKLEHSFKNALNNSINMNESENEQNTSVQSRVEYLVRSEVIACYLYELSSMQDSPKGENAQSLYDFGYCFEHGKGRMKNVSKARQIYWNAMNKSRKAWIPVGITLFKMEFINAYRVSVNNHFDDISGYTIAEIENVILVIATLMLIIVLCLKLRTRDIIAPPESDR